jgi:tetratricopeptide (TPR) repeat protein
MPTASELQDRSIAYARAGTFGAPALEANLELTRVAPENEGAWTRLARCYLEAGRLDEATAALDAALQLNTQNSIARSLLGEVSRRRAASMVAPVKAPRVRAVKEKAPKRAGSKAPAAMASFDRQELQTLAHSAPAVALDVLGPRLEALLMALNERPFAGKIADARNKAGRSGVRLFRRGGFETGEPNQIVALHYGGRREPQITIAVTSAVSPVSGGRDSIRAGLRFDLTALAGDGNREDGQTRALAYFAGFQQLLASQWQAFLSDWLSRNGGYIQIGADAPATDLSGAQAVERLMEISDPAAAGSVFIGRWLFADRVTEAEVISDAKRLESWMAIVFEELLPLWTTVYRTRA